MCILLNLLNFFKMYIYWNLLVLFLIACSVSELLSVGTCFIDSFFHNFNMNYAPIRL